MAEKHDDDSQHDEHLKEKENVLHTEVLDDPDLLNGAFEAENREHQQGLWVSVELMRVGVCNMLIMMLYRMR